MTQSVVYLCRVCGVVLVVGENCTQSRIDYSNYICKGCKREQSYLWAKENVDKVKTINIRYLRKKGHIPFGENKDCSSYLGVHIAERVLRHAFKDVEMMPYGNPGYDFKCNQGMLIDGKSSCQLKDGSWMFTINNNPIADYFLFLAFDNRKDLNTLYAWLIPGDKINHLTGAGISPSTIHKWDEYKLDITKISACCDILKGDEQSD